MSLKVYNTLSREKEAFKPLQDEHVKMYVCGPTVYGLLHIGNFRGPIFYNLVRNWLEKSGYQVSYAYNYTDVDDKIIKKANEEGVESSTISERYIQEFQKDFQALRLRKHDYNPKVTETMEQIIDVVDQLIKNDHAYVIDGEVFYSIDKFSDYGKLSKKKLDDLNAGQRVDVDTRKKNPHDFVLWKPSKQGEPSWDSPWGKGRPGWHIECTAMIRKIFGNSIDIHGGGVDLIFPHHENEIAQGEGHCSDIYCKYWIHNNFINLNDEKMSKSLGNIISTREFIETYHPEVLKYVILSSHYRSLLNVNEEKIEQSITALSRFYKSLEGSEQYLKETADLKEGSILKNFKEVLSQADKKIKTALDDDFNTGEMFSAMFEVVRNFNAQNFIKKKKDPNAKASILAFSSWLKEWGQMSALFQDEPRKILKELDQVLIKMKKIDTQRVHELLEKRNQARSDKNWELSDQYRDELLAMDIEINDSPTGTTWEVKK